MKVLIAYFSRSGSTREVAERIRAEMEQVGWQVEVRPVAQVVDLSGFDAVIAGGLLYRLGWHPELVRFLRKHRAALRENRVALFVTGLRLVRTSALTRETFPVFVDPAVEKLAAKPGRLSPAEWFTTYTRYLGPVLGLIRELNPAGLAFFGGSLQLFSLSPFERVTAILLMALTGIQPGDHRNWDAVKEWSGQIAQRWAEAEPVAAAGDSML